MQDIFLFFSFDFGVKYGLDMTFNNMTHYILITVHYGLLD